MRRDIAKTSDSVSVGTSDTLVLANNPARQELSIVNDGANVVYLMLRTQVGVTNPAVLNKGIRLNANGGTYTTNSYSGEVRGIASTGATVVTVVEI